MNKDKKNENERDMSIFDRGVITMLSSCELGEKEFIMDVLKKIDDSKNQWKYFGKLIQMMEMKNSDKKSVDERINYLDQNITMELSDFFKNKKISPYEVIFVLEKFRFTSYMALIAMIRKIKDDKGEKNGNMGN